MTDNGGSTVRSPGELVVDTEPERIEPERKAPWRWLVLPVLVLLMLLGVWLYLTFGELDETSASNLSTDALLTRAWQHLWLTAVCTVAVLLIAIPLGILVTRKATRAAAPVVVGLANVGAAAPSIGLLVLFAIWMGVGVPAAIVGLTVYAVLPVLRNTITGLEGIDPRVVEAGRGMGMSALEVLVRIELPLAVPVILAGARTALVLLVGTAALAGLVSAGGLGYFIDVGIKLNRPPVLIVGALLTAALALIIDWLGQVVEDIARPKGV